MSSTTQTKRERREAARAARITAESAAAAREQRRRRLWQVGGVLALAAAIVVVAIVASERGRSEPQHRPGQVAGRSDVERLLRGIPQHGIALGRSDAPVTLVEFADLKCPICRAFTDQVLPTLISRYVRPGRLRIEFRAQHFVGEQLNPGDSEAAARAAEAAGLQNKLWNFTELFYVNQQDETRRYVSDQFVGDLAAAIPGLDRRAFMSARSGARVEQALARAGALFARYGFTGTPSFLVGGNGRPLQTVRWRRLARSEFEGPIEEVLRR